MYKTIIRNKSSKTRYNYLDNVYQTLYSTETVDNTIKHGVNYYETLTLVTDSVTEKDLKHIEQIKKALIKLNEKLDEFIDEQVWTERNAFDFYDTFYIPKHSGGYRQINSPNNSLRAIMAHIKMFLEYVVKVQYHNSAYAYFKGRGVKDAVIKHQQNNSKWFLKLDLKDFFTNCNFKFIIKQLQKLYPFRLLYEHEDCARILNKMFSLCMLADGLPQGSPLSPMLTNLIMIPIDEKLYRILNQVGTQHYTYTRYADDIIISSTKTMNVENIINIVKNILTEEEAPFTINENKTRYGSIAGRNWNLGLMLNKDNNITIGHKKKFRLKAAINNFARDFTNGVKWSTIDVQVLLGNISYLNNIEPDYATYIIQKYNSKYNIDIMRTIKDILK